MLLQRRINDALIGTGLDAVFILDLNHAGFHCHFRKAVDNKSIMYRLYKKGTFTLQGATAESRGKLVILNDTPYIEITFTNQSVKIVLRNKNAILSTINVKQMQVISGVDPLITVRNELEKIEKYIEVLYN